MSMAGLHVVVRPRSFSRISDARTNDGSWPLWRPSNPAKTGLGRGQAPLDLVACRPRGAPDTFWWKRCATFGEIRKGSRRTRFALRTDPHPCMDSSPYIPVRPLRIDGMMLKGKPESEKSWLRRQFRVEHDGVAAWSSVGSSQMWLVPSLEGPCPQTLNLSTTCQFAH